MQPTASPPAHSRALFACLSLATCLLTSACASAGERDGGSGAGELAVRLSPVPVPDEIARQDGRIGRLRLVAAYALESRASAFGGLSAVRLVGDDLLLLSDRGRLFRARRDEDGTGRLRGLRDWTELPLPEALRTADTEALAVRADGALVIAAEDRDALFVVGAGGGVRELERKPLPPFLREPPLNQGIETLTTLPDEVGGGLLAVTEGLSAGVGLVAAGRLDASPGGQATRLAVRAHEAFQPTDAAAAGDVLFLLQRRLTLLGGLEARLLAIPLDRLGRAGAAATPSEPLSGQELARLGQAAFAENFEGIDARRVGPDRYRIYLVADDNFSPLLRSLLLELEWRTDEGEGPGEG